MEQATFNEALSSAATISIMHGALQSSQATSSSFMRPLLIVEVLNNVLKPALAGRELTTSEQEGIIGFVLNEGGLIMNECVRRNASNEDLLKVFKVALNQLTTPWSMIIAL